MKKYMFAVFVAIFTIISTSSFATEQRIQQRGTIKGYVHFNKPYTAEINNKKTVITGQIVYFPRYYLSDDAKQYLREHLKLPYTPPNLTNLPPQAALGMNGVPVLNQAEHGTCATFSTTGALDAAIGQGDYISQLCNLSLGRYLNSQNGQYPSGWDGSSAYYIFGQIKQYGAVPMQVQLSTGCAGVRRYSRHHPGRIGNPMSITEFNAVSQNIMQNMSYVELFNHEDILSPRINTTTILDNIRTAINSGNRVVLGFFLDTHRDGGDGVMGKYSSKHDTWVLATEIIKDMSNPKIQFAGHEVVVTGYDDTASATDSNKQTHIGLLTIRNSWGKGAGDDGDYYMSYDYLSNFLIEAYQLIPA